MAVPHRTTPMPPRTRSALTEIPIRMGLLRVSTDELFTNTVNNNNNVNTVLNPALIDSPVNNISSAHISPAPSPDELVIRQRGRRRISLTWLSTSPERQSAPNSLSAVPVLCTPPKLPTITMTLRSSPRKRILDTNPTTPTRTITNTTPDKRNITWSASSSMSSSNATNSELSTASLSSSSSPPQPSTSGINCSLPIISHPPTPPPSTTSSLSSSPPSQIHPITKRLRFTEKTSGQINGTTPLPIILKGLSHEQLSDIIQGLITTQPELEKEIRDRLPTPDIRPMKDQLIQLKKNIFKSLPTTRLVKKTDSVGYSRASIHLSEFKKAITEQTRTLYQSKHWDALYDYCQMSWQIVRATPIWDNNSHNNTRRHCFRLLTSHLNAAFKSGGILLGEQRINEMKYRLNQMIIDYEDILCVESLLEKLILGLEQHEQCKTTLAINGTQTSSSSSSSSSTIPISATAPTTVERSTSGKNH